MQARAAGAHHGATVPARRALASMLCIVLFAAAGCGGGGGRARAGNHLIAAIAGEPDRFDPHLTTAYASFQVLENVYDTLVQPGDNLSMAPALATGWDVSNDNLVWTFALRKGVKWHNGRDLVAADVVFSYERIMDEGFGSPNAYRLETVESVRAPDDHTVEIRLTQPTPHLLTLIGAFKGMAIVPREIVEDGSVDRKPVGTGPFRFVEYVANDRVELERNADYWQQGKPHLDRVVFKPIPDETVKVTNLRSGEVDWVDGVPPQQAGELERGKDVAVESVPSNDYWYLATNLKREPFTRREVRRAIAMGIDREAVRKAAKFGAATSNQTAAPKTSPWHLAYTPYRHDVEEAKRLLEGAGLGGGFAMDLMVTDEYPETVTAAQVIESDLKPLGIDVKVRTLDFSTWLDEQGKGNFDAFLLGWIGNLDAQDYYHAQHRTGESNNFHGYSNPSVDDLLDRGAVEVDPQQRKDIYDQAVRLIVDDASYIYLYNPHNVVARRGYVKGFTVRPDKAVRFRDTRIES